VLLALVIHRALYVGFSVVSFHVVYFVLFVSDGIHLFGGAVCVGVEGKWCEFMVLDPEP
jgi:hypothetical protein